MADVVADPLVAKLLAGQPELRQSTLRLWGTPESELAATLRAHDAELAGLEITTCLREGGELEIVTRYSPDAVDAYTALETAVRSDFARTLFSSDGRTVAELVTDTLLERGATIATAESCTAGMLAARLADRAGSSAYLLGGLVTYANDAKRDLLGVPGSCSTPSARSAPRSPRRWPRVRGTGSGRRRGRDHRHRRPGGGTPDKPVGLVHLCASTADRTVARRVVLPGSRAACGPGRRGRAAPAARPARRRLSALGLTRRARGG